MKQIKSKKTYSHVCKYDKIIESIDKRLDKIEVKIDTLLNFKYTIMSGAGIIGALISWAVAWFVGKN